MLHVPRNQTEAAKTPHAGREYFKEANALDGLGQSISEREAVDLLSRLRSEHLKVQAIAFSPEGVSSAILGYLRSRVDDRLWAITSESEKNGTALSFELSMAVARKFGDEQSMRADAVFPFRFRFESALSFAFQDGSTLALFEFEDAPLNSES